MVVSLYEVRDPTGSDTRRLITHPNGVVQNQEMTKIPGNRSKGAVKL